MTAVVAVTAVVTIAGYARLDVDLATNPKIGELAGRRQHPAERSGAGFGGVAGQAAVSRVTLYPRASSWRT